MYQSRVSIPGSLNHMMYGKVLFGKSKKHIETKALSSY